MEHVRSKKKLTPPIIAGIVAGASVLVLAGAYCGLCAWVSGNGRLLAYRSPGYAICGAAGGHGNR